MISYNYKTQTEDYTDLTLQTQPFTSKTILVNVQLYQRNKRPYRYISNVYFLKISQIWSHLQNRRE